jgi:hypothetical protein
LKFVTLQSQNFFVEDFTFLLFELLTSFFNFGFLNKSFTSQHPVKINFIFLLCLQDHKMVLLQHHQEQSTNGRRNVRIMGSAHFNCSHPAASVGMDSMAHDVPGATAAVGPHEAHTLAWHVHCQHSNTGCCLVQVAANPNQVHANSRSLSEGWSVLCL